jgi:hypothetical protein
MTASLQEFETIIVQLVRLALDNDVSKLALQQLVSDIYDEERNSRRATDG